jgi:hypothetical protein
MEKAVIDRFEEDKAVLLVGEKQIVTVVNRSALPTEAKEGTWLKLVITHGDIVSIELDEKTTEEKRETIAEKMARLRRGDHLK